MPLLTLLRNKVTNSSIHNNSPTSEAPPSWINSFVHPDPEDPESFNPPQCLMSAQVDLNTGLRSQSAFYKLNPNEKLSVLLRTAPFVEFPTIEIWEEGDDDFKGTIVDAQGSVTRYADTHLDERKAKRRKLDISRGKKAIKGLLSGYGSDDDGEGGTAEGGAMTLLGGYTGSEDEEEDDLDADAEGEDDDDVDGDENIYLGPAALIELVRQAQALDARTPDEDLLDWGDSDDDGPAQ